MCNSTPRAAALFVVVASLISACAKERTPTELVREFHSLAKSERWEEALPMVDLGAKCASMFGDMYTRAGAEEQARTREILAERLKKSTNLFLGKFFGDKDGTFSETITSATSAEVTQTIGNFSLIYILEKGDKWRIVDRTHERDGVRPGVQRGVNAIIKAITKELGREPTLGDVNERLEQYLERTRLKSIRVQ